MPEDAIRQNGQTADKMPRALWPRVKGALIRSDHEITVFKGLTFVSVLSTILFGYFQYLSAYEEKVSTQYKEDYGAATAAFAEVSNAFAKAQSLQQLLYFNYREVAGSENEKRADVIQAVSARETYKPYDEARMKLRENIGVLSRRIEMQIDWASSRNHNPAVPRDINVDPLSRAKLGEYNFDCDDLNNMPHFPPREPRTEEEKKVKWYVNVPAIDDTTHTIVAGKPRIHIDWYSAKHHVWTMYYCFEGTHAAIRAARQWASASAVDPGDRARFLERKEDILQALDLQVLRLQAFMSLAMLRIEDIRVKYRPNGFLCHVPLVREIVDAMVWSCTPIRKSG